MEVEVVEDGLGVEFGGTKLVGTRRDAQAVAVDAIAERLDRELVHSEECAAGGGCQGDGEIVADMLGALYAVLRVGGAPGGEIAFASCQLGKVVVSETWLAEGDGREGHCSQDQSVLAH